MSIEILDCLKLKRDICVKAVITSQNTAFMLTPALIRQEYDVNPRISVRFGTSANHRIPFMKLHYSHCSAATPFINQFVMRAVHSYKIDVRGVFQNSHHQNQAEEEI